MLVNQKRNPNFLKKKKKETQLFDRVPKWLREGKQYTNCCHPLVVSIGPYHFGNERVKEFEELKTPIAEKLCRDCCEEKSTKALYLEVKRECGNALKYYENGDRSKFKSDEEFNKMMFHDACFVLYFIIFFSEKDEEELNKEDEEEVNKEDEEEEEVDKEDEEEVNKEELNKEDEEEVNKEDEEEEEVDEEDARLNMKYFLVLRDLFLLENQIPLSVIKALMESLKCEEKVISRFIVNFSQLLMPRFAHFMRHSDHTEEEEILDWDESPHLLHLVRENLSPGRLNKKPKGISPAFARRINFRESYRSVTDLVSAGIYFEPSKTRKLTDVKFKSCLCFGTLTLPSIKVDHSTKPLLLNLLAYEMCPHGPLDMRITSYISLMDSLIDQADDVKELRKKRILVNKLGSDEDLAQLFNEIANDLVPVNDPYTYVEAKWMIGKHCQSIGHVWMAEWVHKYFSSPWTLMAFLGALLALALTMTQTIFSAYPRST